MKKILGETKERIFEIFEDWIVKIIISVIVYLASNHVYKEQLGIHATPDKILFFSICVLISWYFLLKLYQIKFIARK